MIEGEEIFESAEETGYRLCRKITAEPENVPELVFSATWDLNSPNRLHVCLQNGQLKVFDVDTHNCARFNLLFRRYTPVFENDSKTEKIVDTHWDKMTTIPDRPDEIIFLLGISQKLKYTALPPPEDDPYPERPLLASTARGDFPGFIFGSPVMEVASHPSRITSLCVSPAGHILASGDEFGNVRLLLLRLLDEISVFKQNERRRKKAAAATSFSKFLPTYNILVLAHEGPVFSMQWLPIMSCSESNNVRNYALVTGSVDRSVRIWRVSCCSSRGITMTPAMSLDTLSTHVLSLNAFLYTDRFLLAKMNRMEAYTKGLGGGLNDSFASVFSLTPEERVEKKKMDVANGAKAIFLAAGTSVGTVYVWKIDYLEVMSCIAGREEPKAGTMPRSPRAGTPRNAPLTVVAEPPRPVVADDGTKLYSLMQTSDRPIIHVTLNAFPSDGVPLSPLNSPKGRQDMLDFAAASAGDVVLAASDTLGAVHIYAPEKLDPHASTPRTKGAVKELTELPHHPLYEEYRNKLIADDDVHKCFTAPLVRIGEQRFPAAVVSCSFPPAYPQDELLSSLGTPGRSVTYAAPKSLADRWDPTEMSQRTGPLLVSNAQGEIILYSVSDLAALAQHHRDEMNNTANGTNDRGVVLSDVPRMRQDDDTISECSVDSDIRDSDRKMFQHRSGRKIKKMQQHHLERQGGAAGAGGGDGGSVSSEGSERSEVVWDKVVLKPMPRSPKSGGSSTFSNAAEHTRANTKANSTSNKNNNSNTNTTRTTTTTTTNAKKSSFLQQEQEDCSEYPRGPPPVPTPTNGTNNTNQAKNTINTNTNTHTNAAQNHLASSVDTTSSTLPRPPLQVQLSIPQHGKYSWESPDSSAPSSPSAKYNSNNNGDKFENMSAYSASAPSTPLPSPPKNFKKKTEKEVEVDTRENPLAQPQITYSKLLEGQVQEMQQVIDNDEFSVSTQLTTRSDRLAAAAAARAAVTRHKRYAGLTPVQYLDGADMSMLLHEAGVGVGRDKTKIAKQVDPEWLSNRKYGGPSIEDMAALEVPEPLVTLRLSHCHMHPANSASLSTGGVAGGAQGSVSGVSGMSGGVGRKLPVLSQSTGESVRTEKPSSKSAQEYKYNAEFGLRHTTDPDTLTLKYRVDVNMDQVYGRFNPQAAARLSAPKSEEFGREELLGLISSVSL